MWRCWTNHFLLDPSIKTGRWDESARTYAVLIHSPFLGCITYPKCSRCPLQHGTTDEVTSEEEEEEEMPEVFNFRAFYSFFWSSLIRRQTDTQHFVWCVSGAAGYWGSRPLWDERGGTGRWEKVRGWWHREGEFGHFGEDPQESEAGPLERKCAFGKVPFLHLLGGVGWPFFFLEKRFSA